MASPRSSPAVADAPLATAAFDYPAAWSRIARSPAAVRDDARLLVYDRRSGRIAHQRFRDLPDWLLSGDAVVVNDSRVIPARLEGTKIPSGGRVEVLLVRRLSAGIWSARVKGKVGAGQIVMFGEGGQAEILDRDETGEVRLRLSPDDSGWLERVGLVPLPPYLRDRDRQESDHIDRERYQTVFARVDGSVAAPTAGLHFSPEVLDRLATSGVAVEAITLHVGPGTFESIRTPLIAEHPMAGEWGDVSALTAERLDAVRAGGGRVIAVGTTTTRVLETAGEAGRVMPWQGETSLFIRPGYRFRVVDALVTNFHLPRSTPLLLAAAFCGREVLFDLYREAASRDYRFYSYGDAMLIL